VEQVVQTQVGQPVAQLGGLVGDFLGLRPVLLLALPIGFL
jgi:hypothetical protein